MKAGRNAFSALVLTLLSMQAFGEEEFRALKSSVVMYSDPAVPMVIGGVNWFVYPGSDKSSLMFDLDPAQGIGSAQMFLVLSGDKVIVRGESYETNGTIKEALTEFQATTADGFRDLYAKTGGWRPAENEH